MSEITNPAVSFANLLMDGLNVMIPQTDIYSLEPAGDMIANHDKSAVIGFLSQQGKQWPVYALSSDLSPISDKPQTYRIIVLMKNVTPAYGLLCEQIYALKSNELLVYAVPDIMQNPALALTHLAHYDGQIHCVSNAQLLLELFKA